MKFHRAKIINCLPHDNYKLWLLFDDGTSGEVDLGNLVGKGVFSAWQSLDFFKSVYIDKKTDTVAWGEDLDLDPYVLYNQITSRKQKKV